MAENIDVSKEDNEPIAYEVAMKRLSKARGKAACYYSVTEVLWNRELEEKATQPVFLESLRRKIEVISPRTLNKGLPMGYMMQWHESWTRLREEFTTLTLASIPSMNSWLFVETDMFWKLSLFHSKYPTPLVLLGKIRREVSQRFTTKITGRHCGILKKEAGTFPWWNRRTSFSARQGKSVEV